MLAKAATKKDVSILRGYFEASFREFEDWMSGTGMRFLFTGDYGK